MPTRQRLTLTTERYGSPWHRLRDSIRSYWLGQRSPSSHEWGTPTATGIRVSQETALNYSAVWGAVNIISDEISSLPLHLYKRLKNDGRTRNDGHSLYPILHDSPNPEMSSMVFRRTMQAHVLTWGNAYAEIVRDNANRVVALWPITPERVTPFRRSADAPLQYQVSNASDQREVIFDASNILHIAGLGFDGIRGYSVVEKARESLGLGMAAEKFGGTFFGNGATFGGVISFKNGDPGLAARENFKETLAARHQGVERAHKLLTIYADAEYKSLGVPPNDAQFLETRVFQVREVARWFKLPPHKLGDLADATFSNVEHQNIDYYTSCLRPWLELWEQELGRKLIAPLERRQQFVEHDIRGLFRGDSAGRAAYYQALSAVGALTINDIRRSENMDQIEGGDVPFVPLNMVPLNRVNEWMDAEIQAKTAPKTTPAPPTPDQIKSIRETVAERDGVIEALTQRLVEAEANGVKLEVAQREIEGLRNNVTDEHVRWTLANSAAEQLRATVATQTTEIAELGTALEAERAAVVRETSKANEAEARAALLSEGLATATANGEALMQKWLSEQRRVEAMTVERDEACGAASEQAERARELRDVCEKSSTTIAERDATITELREQMKGYTDTREALGKADAEKQAALTAKATAEAEKQEAVAEVLSLQDRVTETAQAIRTVLVHAFQCVINRETDRARKAQQSPEKLAKWIETFYPMHEDFCREALRPALRAWLVSQGRDDADRVLSDLVVAQLGESRQQLLRVIDETRDADDLAPTLERVLRRWETERADAMADRVMRGDR